MNSDDGPKLEDAVYLWFIKDKVRVNPSGF